MRFTLLGAGCALTVMAGTASGAVAAPLTLDTLLGLESFGRIAIDPTGAVGVFETRRARDDLPRYDLQAEGERYYARVDRIDLNAPSQVRPLLPMAADAGYTIGPFSPGGTRLVVFRLQGLSLRLGLVELGTGAVIWTEVSPESGLWGRAVEWLSDDTLVAIGMADGGLPPRLARMNAVQRRTPALWARAAAGEAAHVSTGFGAPPPSPPLRRLWRIDARTGAAESLSAGPFLDFEVSPDGRHAALIQDGPVLPPPDPDAATELRRARTLRLVNLETGVQIEPPEAADISTSLLSWSPASDVLLVAALSERPKLLEISPGGGARDVTPHGIALDASVDVYGSPTVQAGWLGGRPIIMGSRDGRRGWFTTRHDGEVAALEGVSGDARLTAQGGDAVLFSDSGRLLRVGTDRVARDAGRPGAAVRPDGPFGQRARFAPMKAADAIAIVGDGRLCRIRADDARPEACVAGEPGAAVDWTGGSVLARGVTGRAADMLTLRIDGEETVVRRLNPALDAVERIEPLRVQGPNGAHGWLYLPRRTGAAPPPVVVIPYPGDARPSPPATMTPETAHFIQNGALLTAAGYAVLYPGLPATPEPGENLADRILAVVDAAAAEQRIDRDRIGLWGHSFGAWGVLMSAAQSSRFGAVVAHNGAFNFPTVIAEMSQASRIAGANDEAMTDSARWLETGQAAMLGAYWNDPERYRRNSPFEAADRITAPVLFVHGELDFAPTQSEQMYAALQRLNRTAVLTFLFGEGHGLHGPGAIRLYYDQVLAWFDRHLRPGDDAGASSSDAPRPPSGPG